MKMSFFDRNFFKKMWNPNGDNTELDDAIYRIADGINKFTSKQEDFEDSDDEYYDNFDEAEKYYLREIEENKHMEEFILKMQPSKKIKDYVYDGNLYYKIAEFYNKFQKYKKAQKYYELSLKVCNKFALEKLEEQCIFQNNLEKLKEYYIKALSLFSYIDGFEWERKIVSKLNYTLSLEEADEYFDKLMKLCESKEEIKKCLLLKYEFCERRIIEHKLAYFVIWGRSSNFDIIVKYLEYLEKINFQDKQIELLKKIYLKIIEKAQEYRELPECRFKKSEILDKRIEKVTNYINKKLAKIQII